MISKIYKSTIKFLLLNLILIGNLFAYNDWTMISPLGINLGEDWEDYPRIHAVSFTIGDKHYVGTGINLEESLNDFWEYDAATDTWSQIPPLGFDGENAAPGRFMAVAFAIGGNGYVGTGFNFNEVMSDFWCYNQSTNSWSAISDYPYQLMGGVGFAIGDYGYVGTGLSVEFEVTEFYKYDPLNDEWTQISSIPLENGRVMATSFVIDGLGYVGTGMSSQFLMQNENFYNDFWSYNPDTDEWTQIADYPLFVGSAVSFSLKGKGYTGTGIANFSQCEECSTNIYPTPLFFEYSPATDSWNMISPLYVNWGEGNEEIPLIGAVGFSNEENGFVGSGGFDFPYQFESPLFFKYTPGALPTVVTISANPTSGSTGQASGEVTDEGGFYVYERGFCWSESPNPTILDDYVTEGGSGTGTYTAPITGLSPLTTYYVRAYAISDYGISYGEDVSFTTSEYNPPENQVTDIYFYNIRQTRLDMKWEKKDGMGSFVLCKEGSNILPEEYPTSLTVYPSFDQYFPSAPTIGNARIVYYGTGNNFQLTGLTKVTWYYFKVLAYNGYPQLGNEAFIYDDVVGNPASIRTTRNRENNIETDNSFFDFQIGEIKPNPAKDFIYFDIFSSSRNNLKVEVYDYRGNLIFLKSFELLNNTEIKLDISNLISGNYMLKIIQGDNIAITNFVVAR